MPMIVLQNSSIQIRTVSLSVRTQVQELPRSVTQTSNSNERAVPAHDVPGMRQRIPSRQLVPLRVTRTRLRAAVLRRAIRSPHCGDRTTQNSTAGVASGATCRMVPLRTETSVRCSWPGMQVQRIVLAARPNPSVELRANGMAHWPSRAGPAAHFALAVQRATPSSPAHLKR